MKQLEGRDKRTFVFSEEESNQKELFLNLLEKREAEDLIIGYMLQHMSNTIIDKIISGELRATDENGNGVESAANVFKIVFEYATHLYLLNAATSKQAWDVAYSCGLPDSLENHVWQYSHLDNQFVEEDKYE